MNTQVLLHVFFVLYGSIVLGDYLEQRKVVFLDKTSPGGNNNVTNYLFRGNEPKIQQNGVDVFAYDLLKEYLANATLQAGFQLPDKFYLIDIKFVYSQIDPLEKKDIATELAFFAANPQLGEMRVHTILGDLLDPAFVPSFERMSKAKTLSTWQKDDLPNYIPSINQLLYTPVKSGLPTVIYFHCECGCDRTGEIGASYAMKYMGMNYAQAITWDMKIAGRMILPNHQWAAQWYCLYLSVSNSSYVCH